MAMLFLRLMVAHMNQPYISSEPTLYRPCATLNQAYTTQSLPHTTLSLPYTNPKPIPHTSLNLPYTNSKALPYTTLNLPDTIKLRGCRHDGSGRKADSWARGRPCALRFLFNSTCIFEVISAIRTQGLGILEGAL